MRSLSRIAALRFGFGGMTAMMPRLFEVITDLI